MVAIMSQQEGGVVRSTARSDMDALALEIFRRVVSGCPFCLGVVSLEKSLFGKSLKYRLNQESSVPGVADYIRRKFKVGDLAALFKGAPELESIGKYQLIRVKSNNFGLPVNCLVALIEGKGSDARAIVVFGGERLEGRLEGKLDILDSLLASDGAIRTARGGVVSAGPELSKLVNELKKINPKRLFDHDLATLAELVNHLEGHKDDIPKPLRPRYALLHEYILKKRLGRRGG